ncbi:proton-conducting transporter membrane subunit [Larkinella sp. VNQ87]|uniref:proton-conducting transporter transmembrane domain-containing protein n=1 Tax=Larkinella sp. VNQ87 TaxID=3400921 RepID=UPI003C0794C7
MESVVLIGTALCSPGVFLFRGQTKYYFSLFLHFLLIVTASSWAFRALSTGSVMQFNLLEQVDGFLPVSIDSLSALFLALISLTFLTSVLYANGYLKLYRRTRTNRQLSFHHLALLWLHVALLLVSSLRGGWAFLIACELMVLSAFILVVFEGERKEVLRIGLMYLGHMQIGIAMILAVFLLTQTDRAAFGFDGLSAYFDQHTALPVFALLFAGFAIQAGLVPFHTWLPTAHLAAPSHVSGLMSGVLIQMGMYGILRSLTYLHSDLATIGLLILLVSLGSGLVGIRYAFVHQDIKKILAYNSIASTGLIGIGIGTGLLGIAYHLPVLAALGFTGSILHLINHSLAKSLLFYSLGSIYRSVHTRHTDQLGGLIKTMPKTSTAFLLGTLVMSGLPPFSGFLSEFMIYLGIFSGLNAETDWVRLVLLAVLPALLAMSGLNVYGLWKTFKTAFLTSPRSEAAAKAVEISDDMIIPKALVASGLLIIGVLPMLFIRLSSQVTALYVSDLKPIGNVSHTFAYTSLFEGILFSLVALAVWSHPQSSQFSAVKAPAKVPFQETEPETGTRKHQDKTRWVDFLHGLLLSFLGSQ